jgi:hypothetical protein
MNTPERLNEIHQKSRLLRKAAVAVLNRCTDSAQDTTVRGILADLPVSIRSLDLGSSHDTGDFMQVTIDYPDGPWQFIMHDVGGDLRVLASGEQIGFFPYTLSSSVCSLAMIDLVLDRLTGTIDLLNRH